MKSDRGNKTNRGFLPLQQVILAASDQSAEETIAPSLPSPPHRTNYLSFTFQSNSSYLKGDKYCRKHEGKHCELILLSFLHAFHPVIELRMGQLCVLLPMELGTKSGNLS